MRWLLDENISSLKTVLQFYIRDQFRNWPDSKPQEQKTVAPVVAMN